MGGVTITELIDKMGLRNMTPELETEFAVIIAFRTSIFVDNHRTEIGRAHV